MSRAILGEQFNSKTNLQDLGSNNPFNDVTSRNVLQSRQNQMLNALQNKGWMCR